MHIWLAEIVGLERYAFEQLQCERVIFQRVHIWLAEIVGLERYAFEQLQCERVIISVKDQIPIVANCKVQGSFCDQYKTHRILSLIV